MTEVRVRIATASRVVEGTPDEILDVVQSLPVATRHMLLVPRDGPSQAEEPESGWTLRDILEPLQAEFDASGPSDQQIGELVAAEIRRLRAERREAVKLPGYGSP